MPDQEHPGWGPSDQKPRWRQVPGWQWALIWLFVLASFGVFSKSLGKLVLLAGTGWALWRFVQ